jgi:hypothetical protein
MEQWLDPDTGMYLKMFLDPEDRRPQPSNKLTIEQNILTVQQSNNQKLNQLIRIQDDYIINHSLRISLINVGLFFLTMEYGIQ